MEVLYFIIPILLGFLISKLYIPFSLKMKVVVALLLPVMLNLCVSFLYGIFSKNSLGYGYNVGETSGLLIPATLIMMITLGFCFKVKGDLVKQQQKEDYNNMNIEYNQTKEEACVADAVIDKKDQTEKKSIISYSIDSFEWWKKLIMLILMAIAFLFALNGRYSYPVEGYILDKWTGDVHEVENRLVDN